MSTETNSLTHYGVKGMKWGRRKRNPSRDHKATKRLKKRTAKELTDKELKKAIGRMSLEKQYKDLNPKGLSRAQKIVIAGLAIGTTVNSAILFVNSPAGKIVKNGIQTAWNNAKKD